MDEEKKALLKARINRAKSKKPHHRSPEDWFYIGIWEKSVAKYAAKVRREYKKEEEED